MIEVLKKISDFFYKIITLNFINAWFSVFLWVSILCILCIFIKNTYTNKNKTGLLKTIFFEKIRILLNPWIVLCSMVIGMLIGIYFKSIIPMIEPLGRLYLIFLNMCIIPIIASAVLVSVSKLLRKQETRQYLGRIIVIFSIFTIATAVVGVVAGLWNISASKGTMSDNSTLQNSVGRIVLSTFSNTNTAEEKAIATFERVKEIDTRILKVPNTSEQKNQFISFLATVIPENIFKALTEGKNLQIVFFFVILGVMTAFIPHDKNTHIVGVFQAFFEAFQKLIKLAMYFLPFALIPLIASQFLYMGYEIFFTLLQLIITVYVSSALVLIVSVIILRVYSKKPFITQFRALKGAVLVTIGTRSSFATLPFAISGMLDLGFEKNLTKLTMSLSMAICKYGKTMLFCIASIFAAFLYDYEITFRSLIIIIIASIFAGIAGSGAPGIISRTMIALVLDPLGIPSDVIIALLLAIDPIVDPVLTLVSTYPNYAASAMISYKSSNSDFETELEETNKFPGRDIEVISERKGALANSTSV